jgi:hypothetical protein
MHSTRQSSSCSSLLQLYAVSTRRRIRAQLQLSLPIGRAEMHDCFTLWALCPRPGWGTQPHHHRYLLPLLISQEVAWMFSHTETCSGRLPAGTSVSPLPLHRPSTAPPDSLSKPPRLLRTGPLLTSSCAVGSNKQTKEKSKYVAFNPQANYIY